MRVVFPDYDEVISWWLPVIFWKTQDDKAYWIPDIGEQVVCLMDLRDEAGAVLGAIYSAADATPANSADKFYIGFKDGAHFDYDRALHILDLLFQDTTELTYNAEAHLLNLKFQDQGEIIYDGSAHLLNVSIPQGAGFNVTANGAQIQIDALGNVIIKSAGQVILGNGALAGVARLGDQVQVGETNGNDHNGEHRRVGGLTMPAGAITLADITSADWSLALGAIGDVVQGSPTSSNALA